LASSNPQGDNWLLYDGECPFCSHYVRWVRLSDAVGKIRLIDARNESPERRRVLAAGMDLNEGMVLNLSGQLYHGDECLHRLALLSTPVGVFNRVNAWLFRFPRISRAAYPILRAGRNLTLRVLGRKPIEDGTTILPHANL
jgi:predicted DCC family thiol-disulfide oxidoreductase YuxK